MAAVTHDIDGENLSDNCLYGEIDRECLQQAVQ